MIDFWKWDDLKWGHTSKPKERIHSFYVSIGDGNGDLLYNTCRQIIDFDDDKDPWTHEAIEAVFESLSHGVRWPIYMECWIDPVLHGEQYRMTQDPWLLAYCCAVHLGRFDLIEKYKPSVNIFNLPDKWAWRRALLGKWNTWFIWRRIIPFRWMQDYVYVFYGYMDIAYWQRRKP